jgi:predicted AlkP superfamily phosphohydrolase/phosphomutase
MQYKQKHKILIIGIDGGTFDVIMPLVKGGRVPNLARLLREGAHGTLLSTIPPVTAPAWSSFITGSNPGSHGVFHFFKTGRQRDTQTVLMNLTHMKGIPFWKVLNEHGCKVGLMNIPLTYPPDQVDGFMISGMLVPEDADDYVYPRDLCTKLEDYKVDINGLMVQHRWQAEKLVRENRGKFITDVYNLSQMRANNALKLMKSEPWDVFMVVFVGSDRISHFFWRDQANSQSPSSIVNDYYVFLDSLIGRLIESVGDDVCKIVLSDHGFGPGPTKTVNTYVLAKQLGETIFAKNFRFSYLINRLLTLLGKGRELTLEDILDVNGSRLFSEHLYANFLGVWINDNLEGATLEERRASRKNLLERLDRLTDPISGKKLIERIHLKESLFQGPYAAESPDLVLEFLYDYNMRFRPLRRALVSESDDNIKTGEHRREGILIASGPGIRHGQIEGELFVQDVTPTILHIAGAPIPPSYDARLISGLFTDEYLSINPPRYRHLELEAKNSTDVPAADSPEETEKLKKFLHSLGYM